MALIETLDLSVGSVMVWCNSTTNVDSPAAAVVRFGTEANWRKQTGMHVLLVAHVHKRTYFCCV
jgi:hypothetical protein